jgi:hypothetical protein
MDSIDRTTTDAGAEIALACDMVKPPPAGRTSQGNTHPSNIEMRKMEEGKTAVENQAKLSTETGESEKKMNASTVVDRLPPDHPQGAAIRRQVWSHRSF